MKGGLFGKLRKGRVFVSLYLVCAILIGCFGDGLIYNAVNRVEAAESTIDALVQATGTSHLQSGSQTVFVNDQTGYKFYRDSTGICVYSKTTDGGVNWGAAVTIDAQTDCIEVQVWYDQWTPGMASASTSIHIVTMDSGNGDIWYNRLDTGSDTRLLGTAPVSMITNSGQGGSLALGENRTSITRGTDGTIYAVSNDGTNPTADSYIVECTVSCNVAASWTETGTNPLDAASDFNLLMPLASGNIMLINRDISLEDIRFKTWNNTAWSATWTAIDANASDNTTYDMGMAATVSSTTPSTIFLAYADHGTLGATNDVRVAKYNGTAWATSTDVIRNSATRAITGVAIGLDAANDDVYVAYSARTTAGTANTGNVYWKTATSSMGNWSAEAGPVNVGANDIYGVDLNIASDQRIYMSWFENSVDDILGDTIADIYPGVHASSTNFQNSPLYASSTGQYVGGSFALTDTYKNHTVTGVTLTESGTIDASTDIKNVKLMYETDTSYPFNCLSETYSGSESQFGGTVSGGFSGANGTASITGGSVNISSTTALCLYPILDIQDTAPSASTLELAIANPSNDVIVTNWTVQSSASVAIASTTNVLNDIPTQAHFHFRNDDGTEALATSKTGGTEDSALGALRQGSSTRLRIEVSNEGSSSTPALQYRLEYAQTAGACSAVSSWTDVGTLGGDFDMYDSPNLLDGGNTTNIAVATGGVTDDNPTFLTPNGGVKDTSSQTAGVVTSPTQFIELEYSIAATVSAVTGSRYCFRVSDSGRNLYSYLVYPTLTISPDVVVATTTTAQTAATTTSATNFYIGTPFVVTEYLGSRNVTSITVTENGTVDAQNDLDNIKIRYDLDTTAPYDCGDQTYAVTDTQFGIPDTDGFSWANGSSTFTGTVAISKTQTMCVYVTLDVIDTATNGQTVNIVMANPNINLLVSGGAYVAPTTTLDATGVTTLQGPVLTQMHYHWRNDNGNETGATSATMGLEDRPVSNVSVPTPQRLRIALSNEGFATSSARTYRLEYGTKITTCSAISAWTDVGEGGGDFDMYNSPSIGDGDTTNISLASGGVTDENTTFKTPNGALKDTTSSISGLVLTPSQFAEAEFSIKQTANATYSTTYCFRLASNATPSNTYSVYPELTTSPERDFEIQRGTATVTGTSLTLTAGIDYVAPLSSSRAFMRITNIDSTGAGSTAGGTQNADDVTAYLSNPANIMTSVTIARPSTATGETRVSWEIIEFIGEAGSDNEMIVRTQTTATYGTSDTTLTGASVGGIVDDADVVVFITGQGNPDTGTGNYNTGQSTSAWSPSTNEPVFTRGDSGGDATVVSYAVVEFTGPNWIIQRNEHTYTASGVTETEPITAVGSLARTFIHSQKRNGSGISSTDQFGHEVWLSSIGYVSYALEPGSASPSGQTSVVWILENTQTNTGAMSITRLSGTPPGGTAPLTISIPIGTTLSDLTNAGLFVNARSSVTGTTYPDALAGATIASSTHIELWRSTTGTSLTFRAEIVEWPTAGLAVKQNYYRFYVDNNALKPTDPWPQGATDLGENTVITGNDEPIATGDRLRLRMSIRAVNATLPASARTLRLQYGLLTTTCSGISDADWKTLGSSASSTAWRGYSAGGTTDGASLSGDPPTGGDLLLSVSDVAGTLEEENDAVANPYAVPEANDAEYDWYIENNGANANAYYCFRVVENTNTRLDAYLQYPQLKTANFLPRSQNWRWYNGIGEETPTTTLALENVAPNDIANEQSIELRITVKETKAVPQTDTRFRLQYSEYSSFAYPFDVATSSLCTATSTWCYADGTATDNAKITTVTLSDADSCVASVGNGCGTHNESPSILTGFTHPASAATEYSFTIQSAGPRVNRVYYFRLFDLVQGVPVFTNTGESYPSLSTEGAHLNFTMSGIASSTVVEGVTLDINSTPTTLPFGSIQPDQMKEGGHRLTIDANGTEGYHIFAVMDGDLISSNGAYMKPVTGTNASPVSWASGCDVNVQSCFGYHTGDDTLDNGSTRFSAIDTYARMSTTTLDEVSYSSQPVVGETTDIVYRLFIRSLQDAGLYETRIRYVSVPIF